MKVFLWTLFPCLTCSIVSSSLVFRNVFSTWPVVGLGLLTVFLKVCRWGRVALNSGGMAESEGARIAADATTDLPKFGPS